MGNTAKYKLTIDDYSDPCELLTIDELCKTLNIGKCTAYKLVHTNQIRGFKLGHSWKIPTFAVNQYVCKKSGLPVPLMPGVIYD